MSSNRLPDRRSSRAILVAVLAVLPMAWLAFPGSACAQFADPRLWVVDGPVNAMALSGGTLYIGGQFSYVGPNTGAFVAFDDGSSSARGGWPRVDGRVLASAPDGAGGWYIGGSFSHVAGVPRQNLAHVRADGTLDAWSPQVGGTTPSLVNALAVSGASVYVGGRFGSVDGQTRDNIAAVDAVTGSPTAWNPGADTTVCVLAADGSTIYAAGFFKNIGGQSRKWIAALDAGTGLATGWDAQANGFQTSFPPVGAMVVNGTTIYVGGYFSSMGGQARNNLAALDASTALATAWNPNATGDVAALALSGSTLYAGGSFTAIGGQPRRSIAALDVGSGLATAWDPDAGLVSQGTPRVTALAVSGGTVYAGGLFASVGGQARNNLAALDATTGLATAWNPGANGEVCTLAASGSSIYAAGDFSSVGGVPRANLAALDTGTGLPTSWDPGTDAAVNALALSGSTIYVGGWFSTAGGLARSHLAALDAGTGLATSWDPGTGGTVVPIGVSALAVSGATIYVGGNFSQIGGQARDFLAAIDSATGLATAWNPVANGAVNALTVSGSTLYVAGNFTSVGLQPRKHVAALDATSGLATTWDPAGATDTPIVKTLAVGGSSIYVGGAFTDIGGQPRMNIAALDPTTGLATSWDPGDAGPYNYDVASIVADGSTVYAGGVFGSIGGQARSDVAAIDGTTALATSWNPGAYGAVSALATSGSTVYLGGSLGSVGDLAVGGVARVLPAPATGPGVTVLSPNGGEVLNIGETRHLTWSADALGPGVESVDLSLSRSGAAGPWEPIAAGAPNTGGYDWTTTGPPSSGTCYLRVDARDYAAQVGSDESDVGFSITNGTLGVETRTAFALEPPTPNPVRGLARLTYAVPMRGPVRITLLDIQGRQRALLADGERGPGRYTTSFDSRALRPGVYIVHMETPGAKLDRPVVVLR